MIVLESQAAVCARRDGPAIMTTASGDRVGADVAQLGNA
jgi:hypothetical protein